ncbi:MAG: nucleotidyltransferase domain-containing protein [Candidatus Caldarchaeales archaeon]
MGEEETTRDWIEAVKLFKERLTQIIQVEALIVHGSLSRSGPTPTSDIDVIVISDSFKDMPFCIRMEILENAKVGKVQALGYTYSEIESMSRKTNPLILGALVEGIHILSSERVSRLREKVKKTYIRVGRVWKPIQ